MQCVPRQSQGTRELKIEGSGPGRVKEVVKGMRLTQHSLNRKHTAFKTRTLAPASIGRLVSRRLLGLGELLQLLMDLVVACLGLRGGFFRHLQFGAQTRDVGFGTLE